MAEKKPGGEVGEQLPPAGTDKTPAADAQRAGEGNQGQTGAANPFCPDPVNVALDKLREAAETAKADALAESALNDAVKQDATAQDADTKQVEQTVKDYFAAYKSLVEGRGKVGDTAEQAEIEAEKHLAADVASALEDCFNHTFSKPEYQPPDWKQLQKDADEARGKYDAAALAKEYAQREVDALKDYGKRQQARFAIVKGYTDRLAGELKNKNYATVYMLASLVTHDLAGDPMTPDDFLAAVSKASASLNEARKNLRPLALDYRKKKALVENAGKRADQLRGLRERDVLAAAGKVDTPTTAPGAPAKAATVAALA